MHERILRVSVVLLLIAVMTSLVFTLPSAQASKFWAMIGQPGMQTDSVLYHASLDTFLTLVISPPPPNLNSPNGWAAVWYHPDSTGFEAVGVHREAPTVSFESFAPIRAQMLTDLSYAAVAHARRATSGPANVPDPHPFVYAGSSALFGHNYTFAHNGTINSLAPIEDSLGTGFISLALFQDSARVYTSWNSGSTNRNDSEYYMMLLMKYLLVGHNYYLSPPGGIDSPAEWAINQTVNKIVTSSTYTSVNAVFSDGEALWMNFRKSAPLNSTHFVSYYSVPENPNHRAALTTLSPLGNGWTALTNTSHGTYGQYVCLKPNEEAVVDVFQPGLMANPNEIRVNDLNYSAMAQQSPAISSNSADGSFVAVWETADGNRIKGKWFNQMGLAERGEFYVDETPGAVKSLPAVAHDPSTGDILIVWLETGSETLIKARRFMWDLATRSWYGQAERIVNDDTSYPVATPKAAFDPSGNGVIAWSKNLGSENEVWCEITLSGGTQVVWSADLEDGAPGWTHSANPESSWVDQWHMSTERANSPTHSYKQGDSTSGDYANHCDARLVSPMIPTVPENARLTFYHQIQAELSSSYPDSAYDGGVIEISIDSSAFTPITPVGGYPKTFRTQAGGGNPYTGPMPGVRCFSGNIANWARVEVNLAPYVGHAVQFRFRFGSDNAITNEGWYVDDVVVSAPSGPMDPQADVRVTPDNTYSYVNADACYAGRGRIAVTYAVSAQQQNSRGVFMSLIEAASQTISAPKAVETMSNANDPAATLPSIDRLTDSTFVVGYWKQSASNLLAKRCFHAASMSSNLTIQQTYTLTGITAQPYVQLGARNDRRFYLCYQKQLSGSYEIYTALSAQNRNFGTPELINTTTAGNQTRPAIALALRYDDSYLAHSYTDVFAQRRLVIWQSENQDGSDWGIVARMHGVVADSKYPWYAADRYNESVDGLLAMPAPELTPVNEVVARWAPDGLHLTWPALDAGSTGQRSFFYVIYASLDYDGEYVEVDAVSEPHWIDRQAAISDRPRCFYRVFAVAATPPRISQAE